jgi:hypothetical protein|tara:strand:+ start:233 stop:586 length:354 start_codon:yes stop_codon:yes gene_type:complete
MMSSKYELRINILKNRDYESAINQLHEDFMYIREEGLVSREEYIEYAREDLEGANKLIFLDFKCVVENEDSLVWQDLFDDQQGKRWITTTYEAYKDKKVWRAMLNKKEVGKDVEKIP